MSNASVHVNADNELQRNAIASTIQQALGNAGFTNVTTVGSVGEPVASQDSESLFDMIKQAKPSLFDDPITISQSGESEEAAPELKHAEEQQEAMELAETA